MFTGLVEAVGTIESVSDTEAGREFRVKSPWTDLKDGESIALNGACLTVRSSAPRGPIPMNPCSRRCGTAATSAASADQVMPRDPSPRQAWSPVWPGTAPSNGRRSGLMARKATRPPKFFVSTPALNAGSMRCSL